MGRGWKRIEVQVPRQSLTRQLVFKRMKSILGLGHLPKKDPLSAQAWLQGKLFVGLLIERMVDAASFFPWATPWRPRRSRWREIEFMYRQVGAALLLPQNLISVIGQWSMISKLLAATPRKRKRFAWGD